MPTYWSGQGSRRATMLPYGHRTFHHRVKVGRRPGRIGAATMIQRNFRKYRKSRKPPRLVGKSYSNYKTNNKVIKPLINAGILERKQAKGIDFNEEFLAPRCTDNIQYKAFNLSDVQVGSENASLLGIADLAQGLLGDNYTGKYIHVDNFHVRFNLQFFDENAPLSNLRLDVLSKSPKRCRFIVVAPKLANQPAQGVQTTDDNLFLDYLGKEYGLDNGLDKYPWEIMGAPINKKNWVVIQDHTFKINRETVMSAYSGTVPGTNVPWGPDNGYPVMNSSLGGGVSHKMIDVKLPIHKKVCMDSTTFQPQDLLTQYRCIFITDLPSLSKVNNQLVNAAPVGLNRVAVSARSFMQYVDA